MKELQAEVSELILKYFDEKIKNVNWRDDDSKEEISQIIEDLDDSVQEAITDAALTIDDKLEEWEADCLPSRYEEMCEDMMFRQDELARRPR